MKRALIVLAGACTLACAASYLLNRIPFSKTAYWPVSISVLAILFLVLGFYYTSRKSTLDLVPALVGGFVARFLCGLVFLLVAYLVLDPGFLALALHFMAHWLLFTLAEFAYLSKPNPTSDTAQ